MGHVRVRKRHTEPLRAVQGLSFRPCLGVAFSHVQRHLCSICSFKWPMGSSRQISREAVELRTHEDFMKSESFAARPFFYAGWSLQDGIARGHTETLHLEKTDLAYGQAWWAKPKPEYNPKAAIAGCCLLDCRWRMEFRMLGRGRWAADRVTCTVMRFEGCLCYMCTSGSSKAPLLRASRLQESINEKKQWQDCSRARRPRVAIALHGFPWIIEHQTCSRRPEPGNGRWVKPYGFGLRFREPRC